MFNNAESILLGELQRIQTVELMVPLLMEEAAHETRDTIARRIQQQGVNTAGQVMHSASRSRYGAYSRQWGEKRESAGKQTYRIDFTFTGTLMKDWAVLVQPGRRVGLGFATDESAEKADELEVQFGEAFGLAPGELEPANQKMSERVNSIMSL